MTNVDKSIRKLVKQSLINRNAFSNRILNEVCLDYEKESNAHLNESHDDSKAKEEAKTIIFKKLDVVFGKERIINGIKYPMFVSSMALTLSLLFMIFWLVSPNVFTILFPPIFMIVIYSLNLVYSLITIKKRNIADLIIAISLLVSYIAILVQLMFSTFLHTMETFSNHTLIVPGIIINSTYVCENCISNSSDKELTMVKYFFDPTYLTALTCFTYSLINLLIKAKRKERITGQ